MPHVTHRATPIAAIARRLLLMTAAAGMLMTAAQGHASSITLHEVHTLQGTGPAATPTATPTVWTAEVLTTVKARTAPRRDARVRTVLRSQTPYSVLPARFLATAATRDDTGRAWVRVQIAERPNMSSAWIPASAVLLEPTDLRIVIHLGSHRLEVWRGTHRVSAYSVGIGRAATPTPTGTFAVEDTVVALQADRGTYGRFILTLTAHSDVLKSFNGGDGQIAIHGSGSAGRLGRASSYGCIIVGDAALATLFRIIRVGTPVIVTP